MAVKQTKVRSVEEHYLCDVNGCDGELRHTSGVALMSHPPQYQHECDICGYTKTFTFIYPRIIFVKDE